MDILTWVISYLANYVLQFLNGTNVIFYKIPPLPTLERALDYNQDAILNFTQLVQKYDYPVNEYTVTTDDGYILEIFRIPGNKSCTNLKPTPIFLMHGVMDNAMTFLTTTPDRALGFKIADQCYDVWLGNNRGNSFGLKHTTLVPYKDETFWDYSFHEIGRHDLSAIIDFILNTTKSDMLTYVGHSQGTSAFLALTSTKPEYNTKISVGILLAPIAYMYHAQSLLITLTEPLPFKAILDLLGIRVLLPRGQLTEILITLLAQYIPQFVFFVSGYISGNILNKDWEAIFGHYPDGASTKSLNHFLQLSKQNVFQMYDYGFWDNYHIYGSLTPPQYNLSDVTTPVVLIGGKHDWFSSLEDVDTLSNQLPNVVEYFIAEEYYWSHVDHIWASNMKNITLPTILKYLDYNKM